MDEGRVGEETTGAPSLSTTIKLLKVVVSRANETVRQVSEFRATPIECAANHALEVFRFSRLFLSNSGLAGLVGVSAHA